jgi:hypothetical protein
VHEHKYLKKVDKTRGERGMIRSDPSKKGNKNIMSRKIKQNKRSNGTVRTFTTGKVEGKLPNFDVEVTSPPRRFKESTEMSITIGDKFSFVLDGRQARTLNEVLSRHFDQVQ